MVSLSITLTLGNPTYVSVHFGLMIVTVED